MPKGKRRGEWRDWPRRHLVQVHNDVRERRIDYVLECGHVIEKGYTNNMGWKSGVTDVRRTSWGNMRFACGDCHYERPRGSRSPYTKRCEHFDQFKDDSQLTLPGIE